MCLDFYYTAIRLIFYQKRYSPENCTFCLFPIFVYTLYCHKQIDNRDNHTDAKHQ